MVEQTTLVERIPQPSLVVKEGGRVIQEVVLQAELTIGRAEDNDLRLTDPKVSRHHSRVAQEGANYVLTDLGSSNGTLVNGVRITAPHILRHGEQITIGDTELSFQEAGTAFKDTIAAPAAVPRSLMSAPPSQEEESGRGLLVGVVVAAAVLLLIAGAAAIYLLAPDTLERIGLVRTATQTARAETATPLPSATSETPVETPLPSPVVLTPAIGPVTPDEADSEVDELLKQAEALVRRSKFEEALAIYQDLTGRASEDARPEVGWAWALILDHEPDEALRHARRAAELDPTSAEVAAVLARAYVETGERILALEAARTAVQLDPSSAEAHASLAEAYTINDQIQNAADEADLALVQDSQNANAHRIRGWLYQAVDNDMGRAAGELQIAAGLEPELWLRRHELGELLLTAEDYTTAILAFQDALGIRPKAVTYTAIGEAYYRLGQYDQARASLQQAMLMGAEDLDTVALMAAADAHQGRCQDAQAYYEQALALDPTEPLALEAQELCEGSAPPSTPAPTTVAVSIPTPRTTPKATRAPTLPPLSGRIAFPVWNTQAYQYDTYVAGVDGSGRQLVVEGMHQPAFSPDGEWLAVNGTRPEQMNLFIVRPDGDELKKITDYVEDRLPSWSPDSQGVLLATTRDQPGRPKRIYIIDDVISKVRPQQGRVLAWGDKPVQGEYATWMPDWRIVYKGCDYTVTPQDCGLFLITAGGGPFQQLTDHGTDTAPAGYGTTVVFMSNRDGNWEIYSMKDNGSDVKRLTDNGAHDGLPTWSPDGKAIAFASNRDGAWAVWAMSADGSNQRKLFEFGGGGLASEWQDERISWGP